MHIDPGVAPAGEKEAHRLVRISPFNSLVYMYLLETYVF